MFSQGYRNEIKQFTRLISYRFQLLLTIISNIQCIELQKKKMKSIFTPEFPE